MPNGTIVSVFKEGNNACASVTVVEGSRNVEYIGRVSLTDDLKDLDPTFAGKTWNDLTNAQKKTALQIAVKAERDRIVTGNQAITGISGTVTL